MTPAFLPWFFDHIWQSTLCAGLAGLITLMLRRHNAAVRHRIWLAASLKFLLPFSLLVGLGARLSLNAPPAAPVLRMTPIDQEWQREPIVIEAGKEDPRSSSTEAGIQHPPGSAPTGITASAVESKWGPGGLAIWATAPVSESGGTRSWPQAISAAVISLWLIGIALRLLLWFRKWIATRGRLRAAVPLEIDVPALIPAMSSSSSVEPCVFGIFRPVLLMPDRLTEELTASQIETILLHESAHVDRRDNLGAALHMLVESIFWFHPLVWWIGKRMAEERERACDESVLRVFEEPETYAEAILNVCKRCLKVPLACAAGVASSNLRERIEGIMNYQEPRALDATRRLLLAAVMFTAIGLPVLGGMVFGPLTYARQAVSMPVSEGAYVFYSIDVPNSASTTARAVNNLGQIVGSFSDDRGTHGFLFNNGTFTTLDVPGSAWTIATSINNLGQIVGGYGPGAERGNHGFLLSNGAFSSIDFPGSLDTVTHGINNKSQIVGAYLGNDGSHHGFRLSAGTYTLIQVPKSHAGSAEGINDAGQIVGASGDSGTTTGFLFDGKVYSRVQNSANTVTGVRGLNNLGDLVGQEGGPLAPFRGFIRNGDRNTPIELPEAPPSWNAQGINDLGQIVGGYSDRDGKTRGYFASPKALGLPTGNSNPAIRLTGLAAPVPLGGAALVGAPGPQGPPGPPGPSGRAPVPAASRDSNPGRGQGRGLIPAREIPTGAPSAFDTDPRNLLSKIELNEASFDGNWTMQQDGVSVGPDNWARLCLPWHAISGEYDVVLEFTRREGNEGFGIFLTSGIAPDKRFLFQVSGQGNEWVGLNRSRDAGDTRAPVKIGPNGTRHTLQVRVLRSSVEAFLDDTLIFRRATDYRELNSPDWRFGDCSFGLISWYNQITFHRIEVKP